MQAVSASRVAEVPMLCALPEDFRPRHFVQTVCKRHWVRDKFQTIVQAAVRLDVQIFRVSIGDIQQLLGVIAVCTAVVDFQFYAEMPQAFAVENEVGHIVILVNRALVIVLTALAVGATPSSS